MAKLESALSLEQILEGMRQLSDQEKRALASIILSVLFGNLASSSTSKPALLRAVFISSTVIDGL
jgi:hypothetical protein